MTSSGSWSARKSRRRSSPPTLAGGLMCLRADPVSGLDGRGGARRPSRESGSWRGRRAARSSSPSPPPGASTWKWTRPTGFSCVPPPGPATPVTAMPTSTPSRRADSCGHRLRHLGGHGAVGGDELLGHAELGRLDVVRIGHDAACEDVARARRCPRGARPRARPCRTRRSRAGTRARGTARARSPRPTARPPRRGTRSSGAAQRRRPASPRAPRRPARRRGRRGSRSRARRSSPRRRPRRRLRPRAPSPRPTRSRRTTAGRVARAASSAGAPRRAPCSATAAGHSRRSSPGGPGRTT